MSLSISELVKKVKGKSDLVSSILGWIRRDFKWSLLIIPILFSVLIYSLSEVDFQGWGDRHRFKFLMEIVHPVTWFFRLFPCKVGFLPRTPHSYF